MTEMKEKVEKAEQYLKERNFYLHSHSQRNPETKIYHSASYSDESGVFIDLYYEEDLAKLTSCNKMVVSNIGPFQFPSKNVDLFIDTMRRANLILGAGL